MAPITTIGPGSEERHIRWDPRINFAGYGVRSANQDVAARRQNPIKRCERGLTIHPVQGAADGHEIEGAKVGSYLFRSPLDHGKRHLRGRRCVTRFNHHRRLRVDAHDAPDITSETEREQTGAGAEVDQRLVTIEV